MGVYTNRKQTDASPKRAAESDAGFFERIAGPFWDQVRDVINEWWSHLPDHAQPGVRSRLLDRNLDANVFSALWELYLHEMLIGSGCNVEVELRLGTRGKNPDFLVTSDGEQFVVEAKWTAQRLGDEGRHSVPAQMVDAIDRVPSPNFFLSYRLDAAGTGTPPQKRLKSGLARWLEGLDPDQVIAGYERREPLPTCTWQEAGWCLTFQAIPRSPDRRGAFAGGTIGVHPSQWLDEQSNRVLAAVKKKGGKYGDLGLPFIVAVGHAAFFPEDQDTETGLYGTSVMYAHENLPAMGRLPDGYWTDARVRTHSRVSGVLTVDNPAPWTWTKNPPVLWQSPDPNSLPAPVLPTWGSARLLDVQVERQSAAQPPHTALGLPEHWPVGDAFARR
ncbi:hypothetical protein [Streptomyces sp. CBMA29]|uniref:hypothetical protein n=1 Tax=Streptomyces sp. CBMA29 TaxID=1896314 RepID=UPI001CB72A23|nr:hypothetical protein [Streptomyces sp. CBMA29]